MGGVLRGIMNGIIKNRRDIKEGAQDVTCELNKMAADALEEIKQGFKELGVELREPREWKDVQAMIVQTIESI